MNNNLINKIQEKKQELERIKTEIKNNTKERQSFIGTTSGTIISGPNPLKKMSDTYAKSELLSNQEKDIKQELYELEKQLKNQDLSDKH